MSDPHVRRRIPAYRLGLLDEGEAQAVRDHLRGCAECRATFETFLEPTEDESTRPGHLPLAVITRWDALTHLLAEDERSPFEEHFATCDGCREAREFARTIHAARRPARPRLPWKWVGFGTAAMAAVVAAITISALRQPTHPAAATRPVSPAPAAAPGSPARVVAPARPGTVALEGAQRGGTNPTVVVPRGATVLPLRVPPLLGVGPDARITVRAFGPNGALFGQAELPHRRLFGTGAGPTLDAHAPVGPLPAGHYRVEVGSDAPDPAIPGAFEHAEYDFDLRVE